MYGGARSREVRGDKDRTMPSILTRSKRQRFTNTRPNDMPAATSSISTATTTASSSSKRTDSGDFTASPMDRWQCSTAVVDQQPQPMDTVADEHGLPSGSQPADAVSCSSSSSSSPFDSWSLGTGCSTTGASPALDDAAMSPPYTPHDPAGASELAFVPQQLQQPSHRQQLVSSDCTTPRSSRSRRRVSPTQQLLQQRPRHDADFNWHRTVSVPRSQRVPPLPFLPWTEAQEMWQSMRDKDHIYVRRADLMAAHPALKSHMRSILIDWLIEVCEVHRLHRETFHLAVDFLDRYLSRTSNLPKSQLQLAGITCLMIAAKLEEIYPPKLSDFSYVTDGACTEEDIVDKELVIMKMLRWDVAPVTSQHWLSTYLQLADMPDFSRGEPVSAEAFVSPQFSTLRFVQICQLLDLCLMDPGSLHYKYGVLAAAALFHFSRDRDSTVLISGYSWLELAGCVAWMAPFLATLSEHVLSHVPHFEKVANSDYHNIQVHAVNLNMLEEAQQLSAEQLQPSRDVYNSPPTPASLAKPNFPTPPNSARRPAHRT